MLSKLLTLLLITLLNITSHVTNSVSPHTYLAGVNRAPSDKQELSFDSRLIAMQVHLQLANRLAPLHPHWIYMTKQTHGLDGEFAEAAMQRENQCCGRGDSLSSRIYSVNSVSEPVSATGDGDEFSYTMHSASIQYYIKKGLYKNNLQSLTGFS